MKKALLIFIFAFALSAPLARAQYTREVANAETWMQYAPAVLDITMGLAQVESPYNLPERAIKMATSYATAVIINQTLKSVVKERRPDSSAWNSFPSGHTLTAFVGAELIRQDYGWGYGLGAYALATGVGIMRVHHQRHWWWDVLAGAGIGILSANVGRWTLEPIENLFNYHPHMKTEFAVCPVADPVSGALCASVSVRF